MKLGWSKLVFVLLFLLSLGTVCQAQVSHNYGPLDVANNWTALQTFSIGLSAPFGTITTMHGTSDTTLAFASAPSTCPGGQATNGIDIHGNPTSCISSGSGGVFVSFQLGSNTALTGSGVYLQITATGALSFGSTTGSGTLGSPYITPLNCTVASAINGGCLASSDFSTFNNKQPALSTVTSTTHMFLISYTFPNTFGKAQPACGDLSDAVSTCNSLSALPTTIALASHKFLSSYSSVTTLFGATQPAFTDLSGLLGCTQMPTFTGDVTNTNCAMTVFKINGTAFIGVTGNLVSFGAGNTPVDSGILASSILNNPMTNIGDMIGGAGSGVPARIVAGKTGQVPIATNGATPAFTSAGIQNGNAGNTISSAGYLGQCDSPTAIIDRGTTLVFVSGASAPVIPDPSDSGCGVGFVVKLFDKSAGSITVGRETSGTFDVYDGSTITLAATSFVLANGQSATLNATSSTSYNVQLIRIPNPSASSLGGIESIVGVSHQWIDSISTGGVPHQSQPACGDLSNAAATCSSAAFSSITSTPTTLAGYGITNGVANTITVNTHALSGNVIVSASDITTGTLPAAQLPNPSASTLGGVESFASVPHQFINTISPSGVPAAAQPAFTDISGVATSAQLPVVNYYASMRYAGATTAIQNTFLQNDIYLFAIWIDPGNYTASNIGYSLSTADNTSASYDLGLYGPGCFNGTASIPLAAHTGTTAGTAIAAATGLQKIALASAPVTGIAGGAWYCLAITSSAASPAARIAGSTVATFLQPFATQTQKTGGGATLPSTITAPALSWQFSSTTYVALY